MLTWWICLLEHGIRPFCTLYHWDLPSALHQRGGWLNDDMPEWFAGYTRVVAERLGDRVKDFFTINEPQCVIGAGYREAAHAPGVRYPLPDRVHMIHNLLKSHGRAVQVLRELVPGVRVRYAPTGTPPRPCHGDARRPGGCPGRHISGSVENPEEFDWNVSWYSDPVVLGAYPEEGLKRYGQYLPAGWQEDMKIICQPLSLTRRISIRAKWCGRPKMPRAGRKSPSRRAASREARAIGPLRRTRCIGGHACSMNATTCHCLSRKTA